MRLPRILLCVCAAAAVVSTLATVDAAPLSGVTYTNNYGSLLGIAGKDAPLGAPMALTDGLGQAGVYTPGTFFWSAGEEGTIFRDDAPDDGTPQPQTVFDLGGEFDLTDLTVHYGVRPGSGVFGPSSVDIYVDGDFAGNFAGFDNSANIDNFGDIRSNTFDLTGLSGESVRLDFLSDQQWLGLTEIEFNGTSVPEPTSVVLWSLVGSLAVGAVFWRRRRKSP